MEKCRREGLDPYAGARRVLLLDDDDMVHRQNDAISYGVGFTGKYRGFTLATNLAGFYGYENNGDRPIHWRNNLRYEIKKNIISFRYTHGMKDNLYETYSLGYIRCF